MLVAFDIDGQVRQQRLHEFYNIQFINCRELEEDVKYAFEEWEDVERMKNCSNSKDVLLNSLNLCCLFCKYVRPCAN